MNGCRSTMIRLAAAVFAAVFCGGSSALAQTGAPLDSINDTLKQELGLDADVLTQDQLISVDVDLRGPGATNYTCDTARPISFQLTNQTNVGAPAVASVGVVPACGANLDDRYSVWYTLVAGSAFYFNATTCFPETTFPTVVDVFCARDPQHPCETLTCIASSDMTPTCSPSNRGSAQWLASAGFQYWIRVRGVAGARGTFTLQTPGGTAVAPVTCDPCDIVPKPNDVFMTEACGSATNEQCGSAGVQTLAPGQVMFGNSYVDNGTALRDVIRFGPFPNVNDVFAIAFEAEHPAAVEVRTVTSLANCQNNLFDSFNWYKFYYEPCGKTVIDPGPGFTFNPQVGYIYVRVIPGQGENGIADTYGMPCDAHINDYRVSVSTNHLGACCMGAFCIAGVMQAGCALEGGVYMGDNTVCSPNPCQAQLTGACCTSTGCSVLTPEACAAAAGSYKGHSAPCVGWSTGNPITCCIANFNQVNGVTVQDIYDYLIAWFNAAPSTDVNGMNGVTVQDIFDYLTLWLQGC